MRTRWILPTLTGALLALVTGPAAAQPCIDQDQPSENTCMANLSQTGLSQAFVPQTGTISGAEVLTRSGTGQADIFLGVYDRVPCDPDAVLLASGVALNVLGGEWATVNWQCINVNPNETYWLGIESADGRNVCLSGDTNNPYPLGALTANPGCNVFQNFDYTFRTFCCDDPQTRCLYEVRGVAPKKTNECFDRCEDPPYAVGDRICSIPCDQPGNCPRKLKAMVGCDNGSVVKVKGKLVGCVECESDCP